MTTLKVNIPDYVTHLPEKERKILLSRIASICSSKRVKEIHRDLQKIAEEIQKFEKKYGYSFAQFEKKMPKKSDLKIHEDYIDWFFLTQVYEEKRAILDTYLQKRKGKNS